MCINLPHSLDTVATPVVMRMKNRKVVVKVWCTGRCNGDIESYLSVPNIWVRQRRMDCHNFDTKATPPVRRQAANWWSKCDASAVDDIQ